jgi:hypothetical protein
MPTQQIKNQTIEEIISTLVRGGYKINVSFDQPARNIVRDLNGKYLEIGLRHERETARMAGPSSPEQVLLKGLAAGLTGIDFKEIEEIFRQTKLKFSGKPVHSIDIPMDKIKDEEAVRAKVLQFGFEPRAQSNYKD